MEVNVLEKMVCMGNKVKRISKNGENECRKEGRRIVHGEEGEQECQNAGNPEVGLVAGRIGHLPSAAAASEAGDESDERSQQQPCHTDGEAVNASVHHGLRSYMTTC